MRLDVELRLRVSPPRDAELLGVASAAEWCEWALGVETERESGESNTDRRGPLEASSAVVGVPKSDTLGISVLRAVRGATDRRAAMDAVGARGGPA